eukprot:scaffold133628_cov51-Prasinocladus_malaysianus.AAC.1
MVKECAMEDTNHRTVRTASTGSLISLLSRLLPLSKTAFLVTGCHMEKGVPTTVATMASVHSELNELMVLSKKNAMWQ